MAGKVAISFKVTGLADLVASLKKVAPETRKEFSATLRTIGKVVADDAKAAMPRRTGRARKSVKVRVVTRRGSEAVEIAEGGGGAPYVPWLDFGGSVGRGRKSAVRVTISRHASGRQQVRARNLGGQGTGSVHRKVIKEGRYLYPAFVRHRDDMEQAVMEAVGRAVESAGLEVTST
jgi:HK97 gp10 family phage protein